MGRFNKGFLFGGLLGAGAVWMMTTKRGREMRGQLLDYAADIYTNVRLQVVESKQFEQLTKQKYVILVKEAVDAYIKDHPVAERAKSILVKLLSTQWGNLEKEIKKAPKT